MLNNEIQRENLGLPFHGLLYLGDGLLPFSHYCGTTKKCGMGPVLKSTTRVLGCSNTIIENKPKYAYDGRPSYIWFR